MAMLAPCMTQPILGKKKSGKISIKLSCMAFIPHILPHLDNTMIKEPLEIHKVANFMLFLHSIMLNMKKYGQKPRSTHKM